jgi:hypothetical protein
MGGEEMKVQEVPAIDFQSFSKQVESFVCSYHKKEDTLFLRLDPPRPATSFDWDGKFWIRFDPETREVVGLEIENFESVFIKKYPEMARVWKQIKPSCIRNLHKNSQRPSDWDSFIRIMFEFISKMFQENPVQVAFNTI